MIEIVFSDSACSGLKMAIGYGKGPYRSGCIGVIVSHEDGSPATEAEIEAARQEAEEQARLIGNILGKYQLGVGDFWIALRIEEMLRQGRLRAVTEAAADAPVSWRKLRKCDKKEAPSCPL